MKFLISLDNLNSINGYVIAPRQLAIALRELNHEAKIFCRVIPKNLFKGESKEDFLKIKIDSFFNKKTIKNYSPDVIICNSHYPTDIIAMDYAHRNKKLSLYYVHARIEKLLQSRLFLGEYWPDFLLKSIMKVFKDELKHIDVIVALNNEMKDYLIGLFPNNRIEIISNGIDLDSYNYRERVVNPNSTINLLYVANLEPRKNQLYLIKVMENLPNNHILHIVGGREDISYYNKFVNALKKYKKKNIVFHGKMNSVDVIELYNNSQIFVDSSMVEAQSLVLMEAIACGLPIVRLYTKDNAGVTTHLKSAYHLNANTSPLEFANAVEKLINDKELYRKINLYDKTERDKFSRKNSVKQLLNIINNY